MQKPAAGKTNPMPEYDDALSDDEPQPEAEPDAGGDGFLEKLRGSGVGTEDPMIVGDSGPTDIPPGPDGTPLLVTTDAPVDHLEV